MHLADQFVFLCLCGADPIRIVVSEFGAGDGIRTRNPQLGNLIPWSLSINTLAFSLRFSPLHTLHSLLVLAPFARFCGTFVGQASREQHSRGHNTEECLGPTKGRY